MDSDEKAVAVSQSSYLGEGFTYKSNRIFKPIPPSTIDLSFFKKLYVILKISTEESGKQDIAKIKQNPGQSIDDFEKLKVYAQGLYKVAIHIYGSRGEYVFTENPAIFDDPGLPNKINRVIFENSSKFRVSLQKEPSNQFRIIFDFAVPPIFDFNISPSLATPINSSIDIVGENETWVSGTYQKISDLLEDRKNKHGWLHKNNVWDLFLWVIIIPLVFRILYLLQKAMPASLSNISGVFKAAFYVYAFFLLLNLFRIVFSYARWVFPYLELNSPLRKTNTHRVILSAIVLSIVGTASCDIGKAIIKTLKG